MAALAPTTEDPTTAHLAVNPTTAHLAVKRCEPTRGPVVESLPAPIPKSATANRRRPPRIQSDRSTRSARLRMRLVRPRPERPRPKPGAGFGVAAKAVRSKSGVRSNRVGGSAAVGHRAHASESRTETLKTEPPDSDLNQENHARTSAGEAAGGDEADSTAFRRADLRPRIPEACPNHRAAARRDPGQRTEPGRTHQPSPPDRSSPPQPSPLWTVSAR